MKCRERDSSFFVLLLFKFCIYVVDLVIYKKNTLDFISHYFFNACS